MTLEPPQPPTVPAPAVRPTLPTPPRIDKTPFAKNSADEVSQTPKDSPEAMARDAVANGSGALTKRTVERADDKNDNQPPPNQTVTVIPPDAPIIPDSQSDYDRGQDVLREFEEIDARDSQSTYNPQTSTEQQPPVVAKINYHEGHSAVYWIFTAIFVIVAAFVVVKKFLFTKKPTLTKSQLFEDSSSRLKATADKVKPAPPAKTPAPKKEENKGKHFEVRV